MVKSVFIYCFWVWLAIITFLTFVIDLYYQTKFDFLLHFFVVSLFAISVYRAKVNFKVIMGVFNADAT